MLSTVPLVHMYQRDQYGTFQLLITSVTTSTLNFSINPSGYRLHLKAHVESMMFIKSSQSIISQALIISKIAILAFNAFE